MQATAPLRSSLHIIIEIVVIWIVSDIGFYSFFPALGFGSAYSSHPFALALYYLFWVGVVHFNFSDLYDTWEAVELRPSLLVAFSLAGTAATFYLLYILPLFPPILWSAHWIPPSELISASPWYFLPKSIEIALQQLLVAALVLSFDSHGTRLRTISLWTSALFGGIHLLLVFGGSSTGHVIVFTAAAVASGLVFPYLLLRVKNGFVYAYALHWAFYAAVIVLLRLVFA